MLRGTHIWKGQTPKGDKQGVVQALFHGAYTNNPDSRDRRKSNLKTEIRAFIIISFVFFWVHAWTAKIILPRHEHP